MADIQNFNLYFTTFTFKLQSNWVTQTFCKKTKSTKWELGIASDNSKHSENLHLACLWKYILKHFKGTDEGYKVNFIQS